MKVKVCGMRDADNIAEIARLNPDYIGLIFYPKSPRYVGEMDPKALGSLPAATFRVGVFVDASEKEIIETAEKYKLDTIQLHGSESPELCASLRKRYGVIKAVSIGTAEDLKDIADYEGLVDCFVFDTKTDGYGGSGRKFNHDILSSYRGATPYLLSGGLSSDDAESLKDIEDSRCIGFDINSRFERQPGIKDTGLVGRFIETIKNTKR